MGSNRPHLVCCLLGCRNDFPNFRFSALEMGVDALKIALSQITADQRAQPRTSIEMDKVEEYAADMRRGDQFPPCIVFQERKTYWLADGFHRYYAATPAEVLEIECEVRQGTLRDAILFSCGANAAHGFRRTNEDKRRAVMKLLTDVEWSKRGDAWIERHCAVSDTFVAKMKKEINTLEDTSNVGGMERTFIHPKTGRETVMTFAPRSKPSEDTAWLAKALHEVERHIDMMPMPSEAVAQFPEDQRYFFPVSKLDEMAAWMTAFAAAWRAKIASRVA